jgi:hypothetical protein
MTAATQETGELSRSFLSSQIRDEAATMTTRTMSSRVQLKCDDERRNLQVS